MESDNRPGPGTAPAAPGRPGGPVVAAAGAALAAFAIPFVVGVQAWPEIVVPAYAVVKGSLLYDDIFFPHTPLLILLTAAGGALLGFGPVLFKGLVGLSLAATAALVLLGVRQGMPRAHRAPTAVFLVLLLAAWVVYFEGPSLWPDPFMAPLLLGPLLLLERFERRGRRADLVAAGTLLGLAILVKQTSAWVSVAALAWALLRSRRRSPGALVSLLAGICLPYGIFAIGWAALFGTVAHVRWTLLVPLQMGRAGDNLNPLSPAILHEVTAPLLGVVALLLSRWALPGSRRLRSPLPWLILGGFGMTFPRADLLHLSSTIGLSILALVRSMTVVVTLVRRLRAPSAGRRSLVAAAVAGGLVAVSVSVAVLGGGPLLLARIGTRTRFWDDEVAREFDDAVRKRVRPGDSLVLFNVPYDTLYVKSGTSMPGGLYVNTYLWDCVNKEGSDGRVVEALSRSPGTLVLFRDTEDPSLRGTAIYQFLRTRTRLVERIDPTTSWRRIGEGRAERTVP